VDSVAEVTSLHPLWIGPVHSEAIAAYKRAREAGLSPLRALVVATIASRRDCWAFRGSIARKLGCSVRTVQRAITQAKSLGLIKTFFGKKNEVPPGRDRPLPCKWTHRITVGWGSAGEAVKQAVNAARASWIFKAATPRICSSERGGVDSKAAPRSATARPEYQRRSWTSAELDAELDRELRERERKPPD
jgi:hypothetical protein